MARKKSAEWQTVLSDETHLEGDLSFDSSLCICGKFSGKINAAGNLRIDKGAKVTAEIKAVNLTVQGTLIGDCYVSNKLILIDNAVLHGNIITRSLEMADGIDFEGKCEMLKPEKPQSTAESAK